MSKNRWQKIYDKRIKPENVRIDNHENFDFIHHDKPYVTFSKGDLLSDDYPVYGDYIYMMDDKAIRSDIFGTVWDLKRDLQSQGKVFENIYSAKWNYEQED